jgi:hypothetical protein
VSATVLIGILISISGIYLSLSERSKEHKSGSAGGAARLVLPRFSITRSAAFQSLVFVGLAILGLAHSTSGELASWELAGTTVLASGLRSSIFFLGACLALAGSIGVVFALTARTVALSVAVLGTGAATVLGVSGNVIVSGFSLAVAAICGWWVHRQIRLPFADTFSTNNKSGGDAEIERALSDDRRSLPEPFLTSVAIVLFCWILGATLQTAVVEGTGTTAGMSGSLRALPRAAFEVNAVQNQSSSPDSGNTTSTESAAASASSRDWSFWCAAGLLAAAVGLGYSRSEGDHNVLHLSEADESAC